jgi:hypothetical protein
MVVNIENGPAEMDFFYSLARGTEVIFTLEDGEKLNCVIHSIKEESGDKKQWIFHASFDFKKIPNSSILKPLFWGEKTYFDGYFSYKHGRKGHINFLKK